MPCGVPAMVPALFPALFPALASAPAYPLDSAASPLVMRADVWRAPPFSSRLHAAVPSLLLLPMGTAASPWPCLCAARRTNSTFGSACDAFSTRRMRLAARRLCWVFGAAAYSTTGRRCCGGGGRALE